MVYAQNPLLGALFIIISELMFASMGAVVKHASLTLPSEMLVFARNIVGLLVLLPLVWHQKTSLKSDVLPIHLMRALFGVSAMYCFFYALANLPLAEGMLLKMTSPLFMPLIAFLWLSERVNPLALWAVPVGFVGVALVLKPQGDFQIAALVGVLGGLLAAFAKVTVRRLGRSEPAIRTVFYFGLFATMVSLLPLSWGWQSPVGNEWLLLAGVGVLGVTGQLFLTRAYAAAPATRMGPFTYFSVIFGALYGYLFWQELPQAGFWIGAVLIAVAGLMAIRRSATVIV